MPRGKAWLGWLALAAVVVVLDQWSKLAVLGSLAFGEEVIITSFFSITLVTNPGAAWSIFADAGGSQRWVFIALALGISAWLVRMLREQQHQRLAASAYAFILGGAVGNVIDRIYIGEVVDFLKFHTAGYAFPAFNLADSAITLGVILMLADQLPKRKTDA